MLEFKRRKCIPRVRRCARCAGIILSLKLVCQIAVQKTAEELKRQQEREAEERTKTIASRVQQFSIDGLDHSELQCSMLNKISSSTQHFNSFRIIIMFGLPMVLRDSLGKIMCIEIIDEIKGIAKGGRGVQRAYGFNSPPHRHFLRKFCKTNLLRVASDKEVS